MIGKRKFITKAPITPPITDKNDEDILPPYNLTESKDSKNSIISKIINTRKQTIKILMEIVSKLLNVAINKIMKRNKKVPGRLSHTVIIEIKIKKMKNNNANVDNKVSKKNYFASAPIGSQGGRTMDFFLNKSSTFFGRYFLSITIS